MLSTTKHSLQWSAPGTICLDCQLRLLATSSRRRPRWTTTTRISVDDSTTNGSRHSSSQTSHQTLRISRVPSGASNGARVLRRPRTAPRRPVSTDSPKNPSEIASLLDYALDTTTQQDSNVTEADIKKDEAQKTAPSSIQIRKIEADIKKDEAQKTVPSSIQIRKIEADIRKDEAQKTAPSSIAIGRTEADIKKDEAQKKTAPSSLLKTKKQFDIGDMLIHGLATAGSENEVETKTLSSSRTRARRRPPIVKKKEPVVTEEDNVQAKVIRLTLSSKLSETEEEKPVAYTKGNLGLIEAQSDRPSPLSLRTSKAKSAKVTQDKYSDPGVGTKLQRQLNATRAKLAAAVTDQAQQDTNDNNNNKEEVREDGNPEISEEQTVFKSSSEAVAFKTEFIEHNAQELKITPLDVPQPDVPKLSFGLDRVLFNPGVYLLQDPHSGVYNFDPYLEHVMPVDEFDFNALKEYKTSSEDNSLSKLAKEHNKKYIGSTSSMTGTLSHFHFLLSAFRNINMDMLSQGFRPESLKFTAINRAPASIFLRWQNGTYAIDADKEFDSPNVLMMLGKAMEKLLTLEKDDFERYRKTDLREVPAEERDAPEAYQYTVMDDMLMRSQLDAYDSRLPGRGTFDLKTRAVLPIRMDAQNFEPMLGYELVTLQGQDKSYEREYHDMMRSTMLKYMLQARMGQMDGIFMAYHNIERIFGFQYIPMHEIDRALHGQVNPCLGDQEFRLSIRMLNEVLNRATAKFPERSLRLMFATTESDDGVQMNVFAEPFDDKDIDSIINTSKERVAAYEEKMMGKERKSSTASEEEEAAATAAVAAASNGMNLLEQIDYTKTLDEQLATRPLYCATILHESTVDGKQTLRPVHLRPQQHWKVRYSILEYEDSSLPQAWKLYVKSQAQRKMALYKDNTEYDDALAELGPKKNNNTRFLEIMERLAIAGRKYRDTLDQERKGRPVVVWQP